MASVFRDQGGGELPAARPRNAFFPTMQDQGSLRNTEGLRRDSNAWASRSRFESCSVDVMAKGMATGTLSPRTGQQVL